MKKIAKNILTIVCMPVTCTLASFDPSPFEEGCGSASTRQTFPAVMRAGIGSPFMQQEMQEEFERANRRQLDHALAKEFDQVVEKKVKEHRDHFMEVTLESVPGWLKESLPRSLSGDLSRKITFKKADARAQERESSHTVSIARFLNEIQVLQGNECDAEKSQYMERLALALKDASLEGKSDQQMRAHAALCFFRASELMEKALSGIEDACVVSHLRLSIAQTYYWSGALACDAKSQLQLFEKARASADKAMVAMVRAPEDLQAELRGPSAVLEKNLHSAKQYVEARVKFPSLPSLYEWNRKVSSLAKKEGGSKKAL